MENEQMKNKSFMNKMVVFIASACIASMTLSCATYKSLKTERTGERDLSGTFSVIYYGYTYANDPKAIAVLDIEGDEFTFQPYASDFEFEIRSGVPSEKALPYAHSFVGRHSYFFNSQVRKIFAESGQVIGYEVRPLFHVAAFGQNDILDVDYWTEEETVYVSMDMKEHVKKRFFYRSNND